MRWQESLKLCIADGVVYQYRRANPSDHSSVMWLHPRQMPFISQVRIKNTNMGQQSKNRPRSNPEQLLSLPLSDLKSQRCYVDKSTDVNHPMKSRTNRECHSAIGESSRPLLLRKKSLAEITNRPPVVSFSIAATQT